MLQKGVKIGKCSVRLLCRVHLKLIRTSVFFFSAFQFSAIVTLFLLRLFADIRSHSRLTDWLTDRHRKRTHAEVGTDGPCKEAERRKTPLRPCLVMGGRPAGLGLGRCLTRLRELEALAEAARLGKGRLLPVSKGKR